MKIITSVADMQEMVHELKKKGQTIGFVATMGSLHEGHFSLMTKAREMTDSVVASVFVNPTQFGPNEDFESYPRDFTHDREIAEKAGVDVLFHPSVDEIYGDDDMISIRVSDRTEVLCGKSRPGHFDGVVTVLTKLFHIVQPDSVFFGQKDAQQVAVVEGLIETLHFPNKMVACETVREDDGLAKSSRNVRLSKSEREEAPLIYKALQAGRTLVQQGERHSKTIREAVYHQLTETLKYGDIDYIEVLSYPKLRSVDHLEGRWIIAVAIQYEKARLIDNIIADTQD